MDVHFKGSFPPLHTVHVVGDTVDLLCMHINCEKVLSFRNSLASPFEWSECGTNKVGVIVVRAHEQYLCYLMVHKRAFILNYSTLDGGATFKD